MWSSGASPRITRHQKHRCLCFATPATLPKSPAGTAQIHHAIVDEHGLIYANDRFTGGLCILRYTGSVPLIECGRDAPAPLANSL